MKISSYIFTIILSTLILFNSLRVSVVYAYYELDPVGFIERLCENKDKPELACNGKCHLKKIVENSSTNEHSPVSALSIKDVLLFIESKTGYALPNASSKKTKTIHYTNLYTYTSIFIFYHPPQV